MSDVTDTTSAHPGLRTLVVQALVSESESERPAAEVADELTLDGEGLALNSLGFVRAMVELEDSLDVELQDAVVLSANLSTVGDVVRFVQQTVSTDGSTNPNGDGHE